MAAAERTPTRLDRLIVRRRTLLKGLASLGGVLLAGCAEESPPTYGNILRMGDVLTYKAHRLLLPTHVLAKEYARRDITSIPAIGTTDPADPRQPLFTPASGDDYARLRRGAFADWRLEIAGSVARPGSYSLEDLKRFPARTQVTRHTCEEGWSAIAEWTGVPLRTVLEASGVTASARFVQFYCYDVVADGIDMLDVLHPQTILAYGMNGRDLPVAHGAPLRARVETQLGYKSMKFLKRIVVTDEFDDLGPYGPLQNGYAWYAGI
jgi:DMSO/TMAO reductase YedYZ molybdopterin-dependent catalytic subunit